MTDYDKLVEALRSCGEYALCNDCPIFETCDGDADKAMAIAAAAIEELQSEVGRLKAKKMKLAENSLRFVGKVRELDKRRFEPKRGEIVRCRECRWGHLCVMGQHLGLDGFCSKGEREVQE